MEQPAVGTPRVATAAQAATVARLLDAFNREYGTPTPGEAVLARRLEKLLAGADVIALLTVTIDSPSNARTDGRPRPEGKQIGEQLRRERHPPVLAQQREYDAPSTRCPPRT